MKLKAIQFNTPPTFRSLPLRGGMIIELQEPHDNLRGFRCLIRGSSLFLISPPGWRFGALSASFVDGAHRCGDDPKAPRVAFEVPRAECDLQWIFEPGEDEVAALNDYLKAGRYESEPFDKPRIPDQDQGMKSLLSQVPVEEK